VQAALDAARRSMDKEVASGKRDEVASSGVDEEEAWSPCLEIRDFYGKTFVLLITSLVLDRHGPSVVFLLSLSSSSAHSH